MDEAPARSQVLESEQFKAEAKLYKELGFFIFVPISTCPEAKK